MILYIHGGGYSLGLVNTNRNFVVHIARQSGEGWSCSITAWHPKIHFRPPWKTFCSAYHGLLAEGVALH